MAHFYAPAGAPAGGYDVDNKLAPGSVSRVGIPVSGRRTIVLFDDTDGNGLTVKAANPAMGLKGDRHGQD